VPIAFWEKRAFNVPEGVYFPAEDTYILLERAIELVSQKSPASICELGCGSGIIGISLALACPQSEVYLADINLRAIAAAQANARQHQVQDRVKILESNLFENFPRGIKFDLILFNPPYLPASGELESLEVQQQTEGGTSGLEVTRLFLEMLPPFLQKTGVADFIASSLSPLSDIEAICKNVHLHLERAKSIHIFFEDIILFEVSFFK
jgi:HemK-like putative methylase